MKPTKKDKPATFGPEKLTLAQAVEIVTVAERLLTTSALVLARTVHGGTPFNVDTLEVHAKRIEAAEVAVKLAAINYAKSLERTGIPVPEPITLVREDH